jgi:hypothetical protein
LRVLIVGGARREQFRRVGEKVRRMNAPAINERQVHALLAELFEHDLHAKRVLSLAHATLGVIESASLAVHTIGRALATARGLQPRHAVKQVDRLLSNEGVNVWHLFRRWVPFVLAERKEAVVALDWTDFDADDQCTIAASLITTHGRTTPLVWKTHRKSDLAGKRNEWEDELLTYLRDLIPADVTVTILADRGFGDQKLYQLLDELGFAYVIRFREVIAVTDPATGERRKAGEWLSRLGTAKQIRGALVTGRQKPVGAVVCVKRKGMKEKWCLATSFGEAKASEVINLYARRFTIEENFRDVKDLRFGMGLSSTRIKSAARRDRLLLVSALAIALLTLLGAAGEEIGLERQLKTNTVKRRSYSVFNQGCFYYQWMPRMPAETFAKLVAKFAEKLQAHAVFREAFGVI